MSRQKNGKACFFKVFKNLRFFSTRIACLEEEGKRTREEVRGLRDRFEEEEWGRRRLEEKLKEKEETR